MTEQHHRKLALAKRVTLIGMAASGSLSAANLMAGWIGHSTAVFANGLENAGDLFGSGLILYARYVASIPPDKEHPYGHGRSETIAGFTVGLLLSASGLIICYESFRRLHNIGEPPHLFTIWPMIASIIVMSGLSVGKFAYGKRLGSAALKADAWHDGIAIVSALVALVALALALYDPEHFAAADHWGGFLVGLIVLLTAFHVVRDASQELMDAMPADERIQHIRLDRLRRNGGIRRGENLCPETGLQYHVELHLEVDPRMTVQDSHDLATTARFLIREKPDWVADVIVHIEPFTGGSPHQ